MISFKPTGKKIMVEYDASLDVFKEGVGEPQNIKEKLQKVEENLEKLSGALQETADTMGKVTKVGNKVDIDVEEDDIVLFRENRSFLLRPQFQESMSECRVVHQKDIFAVSDVEGKSF